MLHTTFRLAKKGGACEESYKKMAKALGGVREYGMDTPIPLDKVLEVCGLNDALWSLRIVREDADREIRLFACDCAERVISIFESKYPEDNRPRKAIETSRLFAEGKATKQALDAAGDAAWAAWAARDAAGAARAAAWDAAWAAGAARDAAWAARVATWDDAWAAWAARDAAWAARAAAWDAAWAAWAARDDAWAARAAAWDTAWAAAWAARDAGAARDARDARDAEREWQTKHLLSMFNRNKNKGG